MPVSGGIFRAAAEAYEIRAGLYGKIDRTPLKSTSRIQNKKIKTGCSDNEHRSAAVAVAKLLFHYSADDGKGWLGRCIELDAGSIENIAASIKSSMSIPVDWNAQITVNGWFSPAKLRYAFLLLPLPRHSLSHMKFQPETVGDFHSRRCQ